MKRIALVAVLVVVGCAEPNKYQPPSASGEGGAPGGESAGAGGSITPARATGGIDGAGVTGGSGGSTATVDASSSPGVGSPPDAGPPPDTRTPAPDAAPATPDAPPPPPDLAPDAPPMPLGPVCPPAPCALGTTQCSGDGVQTCISGFGGCVTWGPPVACSSPKICMGGKCDCPTTCPNGQKRCGPNGGEQACAKKNGCYDWTPEAACPAGNVCKSTASGAMCVCAGECCADSQCGTCQKCVGNSCVPSADGQPGRGCNGGCQVCSAGACQALTQTQCWRDLDGDGFGDPGSPMASCTANGKCPMGYVDNKLDCYDKNKDAHPSGGSAAPVPFQSTDRGDGSWDWDCNGIQEKENNVTYSSCDPVSCTGQPPQGLPTPDCGVSYASQTCFRDPIRQMCKPFDTMVTQRCR